MTTDGGDRSLGAPRFDVVLRGYDRRQVDEHLSRLQRVLSRMRADLEVARSRPASPPAPPPGLRPRPTPRPRPDGTPGGEEQDVVGTFTDRMQTILQAAEDEAAEIRGKARAEAERLASSQLTVRAEEEKARATLANLVRQRDAVLADLTRVRGQLEALLSGPTARITLPSQDATTAAAARRDAGAGHPLPGTPTPPMAEPVPVEADKAGADRPGSSPRTGESSGAAPATTPGSAVPPGVESGAGAATEPGLAAPSGATSDAGAATALLPKPDAPRSPSDRPGTAEAAPPGSGGSTAAPSGAGPDRTTGSSAEQTAVMAPDEASAGATSDDDAAADDGAPVPAAESGAEDTVRVGAVGRSPSRS
jgi:syndecan 1